MSDTTTTPVVDNTAPQANTAPETTPTAEAKDIMIPKFRFDEINTQLKELKKFKDEQDLAKAESERKSLIEQGKIEEVYKREVEALKAELEKRDVALLETNKDKIAKELGLPESFKKFLTGKTDEEIRESAEAIAKDLADSGLLKKQEDLKNNLDDKSVEKKDQPTKGSILTMEDVNNLSTKEYKERRDEIFSLLQSGKLK